MRQLPVKIASVIFVCMLLCSVNAKAEDVLRITSLKANQTINILKPVNLVWENDLGEGFTYSISYSTDGKAFSGLVAARLTQSSYSWDAPGNLAGSLWIKVKLHDPNGMLLDESIIKVLAISNEVTDSASRITLTAPMPTSIVVSKADQRVFYFVDSKLKYVFKCSTALPEYDIEQGSYKVYLRETKHWSKEYKVWMPHALFFHDGYALHATNVIRRLGRPASHGCVRLHPNDALTLFNAVTVGTPVVILPEKQSCLQTRQSKAIDSQKTVVL